jgi:CRP-like cAMP-binding protein
METALLRKNINRHISLEDEEFILFESLLTFKKVKAKSLILQEGAICKHSIFVAKGLLRGFTNNKNGQEHVLSFAPEGWWIADIYSLISAKPGTLNIESNEDAELILLSKVNQEKLYQIIPKFERFFRILLENSLVSSHQRIIDNLSLSAEERFQKFCHKFPDLIQRVPQKQLASYIGVTPEFFSKMKNRYLKKK